MEINKDVYIHESACITVSGNGYFGGTKCKSGQSIRINDLTPIGAGGGGFCGGGGGYGTKGANGSWSFSNNDFGEMDSFEGNGGDIYGTKQLDIMYYGSGGGGGAITDDDIGGRGGGILGMKINGKLMMYNHSSICSNGMNGFGGSGGGSGGSIKIICSRLCMEETAVMEVNGGWNERRIKYGTNVIGSGGNCYSGSGGYGRICVYVRDQHNREKMMKCGYKGLRDVYFAEEEGTGIECVYNDQQGVNE